LQKTVNLLSDSKSSNLYHSFMKYFYLAKYMLFSLIDLKHFLTSKDVRV